MTSTADRVRDVVLPVLASQELELYDVEMHDSMVRVIVDRPGGVDLEALGDATRVVSRALDDADPVPHGYTLEVTSPGVERPLRTPEQFRRAVGETVKVKTTVEVDGVRRVEGVLVGADETGITVRATSEGVDEGDGAGWNVPYGDIARARTVFEWGTPQRPTSPGRRKRKRDRRS